MPSATVTSVIEPRITSAGSVECKLRRNVQLNAVSNSNETKSDEVNDTISKLDKNTDSLCAYDIVLNGLSDPWFLQPIRAWEKRCGFVTPIRWLNTLLITAFHLLVLVWVSKTIYDMKYVKWQTAVFGKSLLLYVFYSLNSHFLVTRVQTN